MKTTTKPITLTSAEIRELSATGQVRVVRRMEPQPPKRFTELYREDGWLWSRSTSGEGYEQQDLWGWSQFHPHSNGERLWVAEEWLPILAGISALFRADYSPVDAAGLAGFYSSEGEWKSADSIPEELARHITVKSVDVMQEGDEWQWVTVVEVAK